PHPVVSGRHVGHRRPCLVCVDRSREALLSASRHALGGEDVMPQRLSPFAIETDGVGRRSSYYLNLTRSLADTDIFAADHPSRGTDIQPRPPEWARARRTKGKPAPTKIPYAGAD